MSMRRRLKRATSASGISQGFDIRSASARLVADPPIEQRERCMQVSTIHLHQAAFLVLSAVTATSIPSASFVNSKR